MAPPILTVPLVGHLSRQSFEDAVSRIHDELGRADGRCSVVFDCSTMGDYDFDARDAFVSWHRQHRTRLERVAVVTDRAIWHLVVRTMALAAGTPIRPFEDVATATAWLSA